jgi:hypothetical protein
MRTYHEHFTLLSITVKTFTTETVSQEWCNHGSLKTSFFNVKQWKFVYKYQRFGEMCYLHVQDKILFGRWGENVYEKCWYLSTKQGVTFQKTVISIVTVMLNSKPTLPLNFCSLFIVSGLICPSSCWILFHQLRDQTWNGRNVVWERMR